MVEFWFGPGRTILFLTVLLAFGFAETADKKDSSDFEACTEWRITYDLTQEQACMQKAVLQSLYQEAISQKLESLAGGTFLGLQVNAFLRRLDSSLCDRAMQPSGEVKGWAEMIVSFSFAECDISETILVLQRLSELPGVDTVTFVSVSPAAKKDGVVEAGIGKASEDDDDDDDDDGEEEEEHESEGSEGLTRVENGMFIGLVIACVILVLIVGNYARTKIGPKLIPNAGARLINLPTGQLSTNRTTSDVETGLGGISISIDADVGYHSPCPSRQQTPVSNGLYRTTILLDHGSVGSITTRIRPASSACSEEEVRVGSFSARITTTSHASTEESRAGNDLADAPAGTVPGAFATDAHNRSCQSINTATCAREQGGNGDVCVHINLNLPDHAAERAPGGSMTAEMMREAARQRGALNNGGAGPCNGGGANPYNGGGASPNPKSASESGSELGTVPLLSQPPDRKSVV